MIPAEAKANFNPTKNNSTPPVKIRVLALINIFKKDQGIEGLDLNSEEIVDSYRVLQALARLTQQAMAVELKSMEGGTDGYVPWSKIPPSTKLKYSLVLERKALFLEFPLWRCVDSWGADRLLYESHKNRGPRKTKS